MIIHLIKFLLKILMQVLQQATRGDAKTLAATPASFLAAAGDSLQHNP
jgi:hypothetical protein